MRTETRNEQDEAAVETWRREQLVRAGFAPRDAGHLAADPRYDLHALLDLVSRGCEPRLAVRILAPLDEASAA